jgi:hypothetical protein
MCSGRSEDQGKASILAHQDTPPVTHLQGQTWQTREKVRRGKSAGNEGQRGNSGQGELCRRFFLIWLIGI